MKILWTLTSIVALSTVLNGQTDRVETISEDEFWAAKKAARNLTETVFPRIETSRTEVFESLTTGDKGEETIDKVITVETVEFTAVDTFRITKVVTNSKGISSSREIQIKGVCYLLVRSKWVNLGGECLRERTASGSANDIGVEKDEYLVEHTFSAGEQARVYRWVRYFKPKPLDNRGSSAVRGYFSVNAKRALLDDDADSANYEYDVPIKPITVPTNQKSGVKKRRAKR